MNRGVRRVVEVLLVEDNPGDAQLVLEVLSESDTVSRIHHVEDGKAAIAFLRREPGHERSPRPDLVVLDLNLPELDGREVLSVVKGDPKLKDIALVVFSSSTADGDMLDCYKAGACAYVAKPTGLDEFVRAVRSLERFWMNTAVLTAN